MMKPNCFTDTQWKVYKTELQTIKGGKALDICFDCTIDYQRRMRKDGKCSFPLKRLDKASEYV